MNNYKFTRLMQSIIDNKIKQFGCLEIKGPKWCGKTYLANEYAKSVCYIEKKIRKYSDMISDEIENNEIFIGESPHLIDEWQWIPEIWDKVRFLVDINLNKPGQFILTGSNDVDWTKIKHSGAGRMGEIKLSTLTNYEIIQNESTDFISLTSLFDDTKNFKYVSTKYTFEWISYLLINGGWPSIYTNSNKIEDLKHNSSISNDYVKYALDLELKHINLNINKDIFRKLLKSLARNNGSKLNLSTIIKDLNGLIDIKTLQKYLNLIESMYLIDYLDSWSLNVRSKTAIRAYPKYYLCDPSIGLNLLGVNDVKKLDNDWRLFGIYFESLVIHDLMIFARSMNAELFYFRNQNGFEIDAILQLKDGKWAPIEIKLSNNNEEAMNDAAKRLLSLENKIQTNYGLNAKPSFYMIIVGTDYSYKRPDGVLVVPYTTLKP